MEDDTSKRTPSGADGPGLPSRLLRQFRTKAPRQHRVGLAYLSDHQLGGLGLSRDQLAVLDRHTPRRD